MTYLVTVVYDKGASGTPPIKVRFPEDDKAGMTAWIRNVKCRNRVSKKITLTYPDGTSREIK